jgi:hypothetical protein
MGHEFVSPQGQAMERITKLYQEAWALRVLARRSDMQPLRDELLALAARCERLAKWMEENPWEADLREEEFPADLY